MTLVNVVFGHAVRLVSVWVISVLLKLYFIYFHLTIYHTDLQEGIRGAILHTATAKQ